MLVADKFSTQGHNQMVLNSIGGIMSSTSDLPGNREKEAVGHVGASDTHDLSLGLGILCMLGFAGACLLLFMEFHNITARLLGL